MTERNASKGLAWTGERLVTSCRRPLVYEHLHRYAVAYPLARSKRVLDIACGEGYGSNLLAKVARRVTGVDNDDIAIAHAKRTYGRANLRFTKGTCSAIPAKSDAFDLVASFETIEHIHDQLGFLAEIKRVLDDKGILIISSPHKAEYRKASKTRNPFHLRELNHEKFVGMLRSAFKYCVVAKQRLVAGSWIAEDVRTADVSPATFRGGFNELHVDQGVYRGLYSLAICSDEPLPLLNLGLFEDFRDSADLWNLLDLFDRPGAISARLTQLEVENEEKTKQVLHFQGVAEERARHIAILQAENELKTTQVHHFKREAEENAARVMRLDRESNQKSQRLATMQRRQDGKTRRIKDLKWRLAEEAKELTEVRAESEANALQIGALRRQMTETSQAFDRVQREVLGQRIDFDLQKDRQTRLIQDLEQEIEEKNQLLTQHSRDLLDAQWEAMTFRATIARQSETARAARAHELDLKAALEDANSDKRQLRQMVAALESDLERERQAHSLSQESRLAELKAAKEELKTIAEDLRRYKKQMNYLKEAISRTMMISFGRSKRKLQQLAIVPPRQ